MRARNRRNAPAVKRAKSIFKPGYKVAAERGRERLLWTRMILNAALKPLAALSHCPRGALSKNPPLREILIKAVAEASAIARGEGVNISQADMVQRALRLGRQALSGDNEPEHGLALLLSLARRQNRSVPFLDSLRRWFRKTAATPDDLP
ncbi:MAG: hypothetical protein A3G41_02015 [Elusimicrobia bacterium RIFCSPLOWO2_12_FULL_59_9]|nr:MAG: hypothetical protein A3G41_02015 [Elusimicrobia bacterium RIFCSPLOWO2_12_FULL_59_9]